jgi:glutaredoxin 3
VALELDTLEGNEGNEIRAVLGRKTQRTSVPAIFINGEFIGGCNDGPGLMTLAETGELDERLSAL